ncbi:DNA polymerase lambda subunit [Pseudohyphozyma bogoriensis]|nr:DNA polymerase lambda subunit [Pseudohyphozyma bogoriensis]
MSGSRGTSAGPLWGQSFYFYISSSDSETDDQPEQPIDEPSTTKVTRERSTQASADELAPEPSPELGGSAAQEKEEAKQIQAEEEDVEMKDAPAADARSGKRTTVTATGASPRARKRRGAATSTTSAPTLQAIPKPPPPPLSSLPSPISPPARPVKSSRKLGAVPPPPPLSSLPSASTPPPATTTRASRKRPAREESQDSSLEIISPAEPSSRPPPTKKAVKATSDRDSTATSKLKARESTKKPVAIPTKPVSSSSKSKPKGRGRISGEKFAFVGIDAMASKLSAQDKSALLKECPTISTYLDRVSEHDFESEHRGPLSGTRVVLVRWDEREKNACDEGVRKNIGRLVKNGAKVFKPEDFVGSPELAKRDGRWDDIAEEEGWTTHVVLDEVPHAKRVKFSQVLELLGKNGIKEKDLGPYTHIVTWRWVGSSLNEKAKAEEYPFFLEDDPRIPVPTVRTRRVERKPATPESDSADEGGPGFLGQDDDAVSDFGPGDWPSPEEPPPGYFSSSRSPPRGQNASHATECSDPIVDPPLTAPEGGGPNDDDAPPDPAKFRGLEDQIKLLNSFRKSGDDVEALLEADDKRPQEMEDMIYSTRDEDNATSDEEKGGKPAIIKKKKRNKGEGKYVCERSSTGGANEPGPNDHIAKILDMLGTFAERGSFRERGYKMGAGVMRNTITPIRTYGDAMKLRGIGDSLARKIVEISKTGDHRRLSMKNPEDEAIRLFCGIYGVGKETAKHFWDIGCRSLEDVRTNTHKPLTEAQKLGLKYYDDLDKRIPREEVTKLYQYAKKLDSKLQVHCMGSYRRGQPDCGDIDLLVTRDTSDGIDHSGLINKLAAVLIKKRVIKHSLTNPEDWNALDVKFNGLCSLPEGGLMRRIDILGVPFDELPAALIYFTVCSEGNDYFNRSMRLKARHLGMRLNQRGLFGNVARDRTGLKLTEGTKIDCPTEQDIFARLRVTWRPPEERLP